jgi:hypothetical protein
MVYGNARVHYTLSRVYAMQVGLREWHPEDAHARRIMEAAICFQVQPAGLP